MRRLLLALEGALLGPFGLRIRRNWSTGRIERAILGLGMTVGGAGGVLDERRLAVAGVALMVSALAVRPLARWG